MTRDEQRDGAESPPPDAAEHPPSTAFMDVWLEAAIRADALQAQLAHLEAAWLRAEADADYWYLQACRRDRPRGLR